MNGVVVDQDSRNRAYVEQLIDVCLSLLHKEEWKVFLFFIIFYYLFFIYFLFIFYLFFIYFLFYFYLILFRTILLFDVEKLKD